MNNQEQTNQYQTKNTFTRAPSIAQICSYLVITLETVVFYLMVRPYISSYIGSIVLTVLFSVSLGVVVISSFICSYIDPSDSMMIEWKKGNRQHNNQLLYCDFCEAYVTSEAKHCKQCDRCVQKFDHHCIWINNCVGSKNYQIFMIMIISTCFHLSIYIASVSVLSYERKWFPFLGFIVTAWVVLAIVCILWILLFNLNLLHFYLIFKGYTTYQFIMAKKDEERQQQFQRLQQEGKKRQQRLKQAVEKSKKKLFDYNQKIQNADMNSEGNLDNIRVTQKKHIIQEQNTNARISQGITKSIHKDQRKAYEDLRFSDKTKIFVQQPNQNTIHMGRAENSEIESVKIGNSQESRGKDVNVQAPEGSQNTENIKISQFFIRNTSFNFMISGERAQKPHKKDINLSMGGNNSSMDKKAHPAQHRSSKSKIQSIKKSQIIPTSQTKK